MKKVQFISICIFTFASLFIYGISYAQEGSDMMKPYSDHFGFLGYKCESKSEKKIMCVKDKSWNIFLSSESNGVLAKTYYRVKDEFKAPTMPALDLVNTFNSEAIAARAYVDKDGIFVIEAWCAGKYDKEFFALFIERYNNDIKRLFNGELYKKTMNCLQ